jgi:hypothetical protein
MSIQTFTRPRQSSFGRAAYVVAAAALAAGCGGGGDALSKGEYEQRMQALDQELEQGGAALENVESLDNLAAQVERFQGVIRDKADEMDELEPPDEVADPHDRLVSGMRGFADRLDEFRDAAESGDQQRIEEVVGGVLAGAFEQVSGPAQEIEGQGYDIGNWED